VPWEVWGIYEDRFALTSGRWRITGFTFTARHERDGRRVLTTVLPE